MSNISQQNDLLNSVKAMIVQTLAIPEDQVGDDLSYGELPEWDSLGHMNIMMALEEKYGIQITTEVITKLVNIKDIAAYLLEHNHA